MRCSRVLSLVALLSVSSVSFAQQAAPKPDKNATDKSKEAKPKKDKTQPLTAEEIEGAKRRTERLFGSDEPLEMTLTADFKATFRSRDTLKVKATKATLTVKDSSGSPMTIPIEIEPRGHFRLRNDVCNFPPIRLIFPKQGLKGTVLAGQKSLKLGTHCQQRDKEYSEYPVREHAAYEVLNLLTDASFRSRLAQVTYVQAGDDKDTFTKLGLLIEDEDDVAKRIGGRVHTIRGGTFGDMDPAQMGLISVFAYFLGNTDWSLSSLHNMRLVLTGDGRYVPIPYDFDWSGAVFARYAKPDPRLGIRTVQERLFRGPCMTADELAPALAKFTAQRDAIRALYARLPLDDGYRKRVLDYYEDFYHIIGDQRQVKREIIESCSDRKSAFRTPDPSIPRAILARSPGAR
jgi:hypothetical protein